MRGRPPFKHAVISLVCLGVFAHSPAQQAQSGQISGHVVDAVGGAIRGASVFVRRNTPSDETISLMTQTDIKGDFTLALPEGGYDILVTSPGFAAMVKTLPVLGRKIGKFEWKLKVLNCNFPGMDCDTFR